MASQKYKFDYVNVEYHKPKDQHPGFILFSWSSNCGWGAVTCKTDPQNGNVIVDTEYMSLEFFYAMLEAWKK